MTAISQQSLRRDLWWGPALIRRRSVGLRSEASAGREMRAVREEIVEGVGSYELLRCCDVATFTS
jgi:hypothetical protein